VKWFVLDAEAIDDIDTTGADALEQIIEFLHKRNITFAMSRAYSPVPELLETYDLMEKIGEERLYATNRRAADAFYHEAGTLPFAPKLPADTAGLQPAA
jgi:MFS superfamily sulfate permease-like transporter